MSQAADKLGVTNHVIRRLIHTKILPARQVVPRAPYQIRAIDLDEQSVRNAILQTKAPRRINSFNQIPMFSNI